VPLKVFDEFFNVVKTFLKTLKQNGKKR